MLTALRYLLIGTRSGTERLRALRALDTQPRNAEQLADGLHLDVDAVRHHVEVLEANGMVATATGEGSGYHLTSRALANWDEIQSLIDRTEEPD